MNSYDGHDRFNFTGPIKRVTAGDGGEVWLITGTSKTAVIDCGMAYCGKELVSNIKKELGERPLDYAFLSHTHYDHIGGLPYLREEWQNLESFGSEYGKKILEKETALFQIKKMAEYAWKRYSDVEKNPEVKIDGLYIDRVLKDGDVILLGEEKIVAYETPGHTNCSLSFLLEPYFTLFPSETAGVYAEELMITGVLKSYSQSVESIVKSKNLKINNIVAPHYGQVPLCDVSKYWDMAIDAAKESKDFILEQKTKGKNKDKILEAYTENFWTGVVKEQQPLEAFLINAQNLIDVIFNEF